MASHKRTPCVGICSTTYGDLVCRGCKRFAHEIVMWNRFDDDQHQLVWARLHELRDGAVLAHLEILDVDCLKAQAAQLRVPDAQALSPANLAYEVLRRSSQRLARGQMSLDQLGVAPRHEVMAVELLGRIDAEFLERSVARYEHAFHTVAQ